MYSDQFRALFVHIPKTAGQSVEQVFVARHRLDWNSREPLLLRRKLPDETGPAFLAHLYAHEYVPLGYVAADAFAAAFKFTVVRNPYDRALSELRYRDQRERTLRMDAFLRQLGTENPSRHVVPQARFILDSDRVLVDRILRFETLAQDFAEVSERVFGERLELPHANKSVSKVPSDVFDADARAMIYKAYEEDFDLFRYPRRD